MLVVFYGLGLWDNGGDHENKKNGLGDFIMGHAAARPAAGGSRRGRRTAQGHADRFGRLRGDAAQSYALYLPSAYSGDRRWPIIYCFDPGARGPVPVRLFRAAEKYGYILVCSNNSHNGPWEPINRAMQAVWTRHAETLLHRRRPGVLGRPLGRRPGGADVRLVPGQALGRRDRVLRRPARAHAHGSPAQGPRRVRHHRPVRFQLLAVAGISSPPWTRWDWRTAWKYSRTGTPGCPAMWPWTR